MVRRMGAVRGRVGDAVSVSGGTGNGMVVIGTGGGELGPAGALEVFAGGEAEEGCAVATGVEYEEGMGGGVTCEREEDRAGGRDSSGRGRGGKTGMGWAREGGKGGGGEEDDVCVRNEL